LLKRTGNGWAIALYQVSKLDPDTTGEDPEGQSQLRPDGATGSSARPTALLLEPTVRRGRMRAVGLRGPSFRKI
ncbi:hypothetical protein AB0383_34900, partial [Amycolatopsis sp. NPDC051373]|uniref:hypothetical protein n=1 Tax=Amycolatopsis sp. NPDC051373 TaxID=3155801 RepID=UPI00344D2A60